MIILRNNVPNRKTSLAAGVNKNLSETEWFVDEDDDLAECCISNLIENNPGTLFTPLYVYIFIKL